MAKSRRKSKRRGSRRRRKRGGHHSLASTAAPYTPAAFAPPGGIYKPGSVNGLDGGYYYGVNVDQSLPDPIATSALFRQRGGRRRKRKTRRHRHTKRCHNRRRRHRHTKRCRPRKRKTRRHRHTKRCHNRRRRHRGGKSCKYNYNLGGPSRIDKSIPSLKRVLTTVIPKDILDMGYKGGNIMGNLYRGYIGERPKIPPVPYTNQPINQPINTLGYQPVNANNAYNNAINTVNKGNTPVAQASY